MKMYKVTGIIKCGHRLFKLEKFIVSHDRDEAIAIYRASRPTAKMVQAEFRFDVTARNFVGIWKDDILTKIENNA